MNTLILIAMALVMALVTYVIRMIPFTFFKRKIKSRYIKSLLYYLPYAVLSAMTFPMILYSTGSMPASLVGTVSALICAIFKRPLMEVAIIACVTALLALYVFPIGTMLW